MSASKPQKRWKPALKLILVLTALSLGFLFWYVDRLHQQKQQNRALIGSIKAQDRLTVLQLLEEGADANASETSENLSLGQVLLHLFGRHIGNTDVASHPSALILASRDLDGYRPPDEEIILALLNHHAYPNVEDDANHFIRSSTPAGRSPVGCALWHNHIRALRRLLECGANPNAKAGWYTKNGTVYNPQAPLMYALTLSIVERSDVEATQLEEAVRLLLEHGADVNATNSFSATPLMVAAYVDDPEVVLLLLQHGAKMGVKDQKGRTALVYASDRLKQGKAPNNRKIISLLKQFGAKE